MIPFPMAPSNARRDHQKKRERNRKIREEIIKIIAHFPIL